MMVMMMKSVKMIKLNWVISNVPWKKLMRVSVPRCTRDY